jgi:hypothetical protein
MRFAPAALLVIAVCLIGGCTVTTIGGSGNVVTETRTIEPATGVSLEAPVELTLRQGPSVSLTVTGDDNILEHLRTEVKDGTLSIAVDGGHPGFTSLKPTAPIRCDLTLPVIDALEVSGSGSARADSLKAKELSIAVSGSGGVQIQRLGAEAVSLAVSGSGTIQLGGDVQRLSIAVSGSGDCDCGELRSADAEVAVSGSGDVITWAEKTLDAAVSGSGSVSYYGDPVVEEQVSGSGEVRRLGPHVINI